MVKRLPGMRETRVPCLSWEDPLEKEMATHSSILALKILALKKIIKKKRKKRILALKIRSLVGYSPWGRKEWDRTKRLHFHFHLQFGPLR